MNTRERIADELLVLRCQEGDVAAFEQLVERWQERLWRHDRYFVTVELPPGAKVESAEPQPVEQTISNGQPLLVFSATRGRNERFEYKVQYRLPEASDSAKESP